MNEPILESDGSKRWYNEHDQLHRTDGPAVIYTNGGQYWFINNKFHRTDGPAIIRSDGTKEFWIHNIQLTEDEYYDIIQSEEHLNWFLLKIL